MKAIKKLLIILVVLVVVVCGVAFLLPSTYRVERSVVINAKPKAVYAQIGNLKQWPKWTVWNEKLDPTMTITFEGPEEGTGATYRWTGEKVGNGMLMFNRTEDNKGVWYGLDFENGKYVSEGAITIEPQGDAVKVTWHNGGNLGLNPINRYFGLLMDRMMGPDFEQGLNNLKLIVEAK